MRTNSTYNLRSIPSFDLYVKTETLETPTPDWRLCVAPMIDVTDRHCRYFHRLLAPQARLYTEMITTAALQHGKHTKLLDFDPAEEPVALQLGGCDPQALAVSARLGEQWGYNEINLNCGCPSERVQRGAFGACLMAEPDLVADGMKAMQDAVSIPVTVKHRLGLDYNDSYDFVRDFVGKIYDTGCRVFIVHARNAVLKGLSPRDNREKPPLRYSVAARLKADFPDCTMVLNGGITEVDQATSLMQQFDGVMLGRAAWHNPGVLADITRACHPGLVLREPAQVVQGMVHYAAGQIESGVPLRLIVRSMLGWMNGRNGARFWRRTLSDHTQLNRNDPRLIEQAWSDLMLRTSSDEAYELAASESDGQSRI